MRTLLILILKNNKEKNLSNLISGLNQSFPKVYSFWIALLFTLDIYIIPFDFYFNDSYLRLFIYFYFLIIKKF